MASFNTRMALPSFRDSDSHESVKVVDTTGSMMDLWSNTGFGRNSRASAGMTKFARGMRRASSASSSSGGGSYLRKSSGDSVGRADFGLHPTIEEDEEEEYQTESDEDSDWSDASQSQASNSASAISLGRTYVHEANLSAFEIGNPLGEE